MFNNQENIKVICSDIYKYQDTLLELIEKCDLILKDAYDKLESSKEYFNDLDSLYIGTHSKFCVYSAELHRGIDGMFENLQKIKEGSEGIKKVRNI